MAGPFPWYKPAGNTIPGKAGKGQFRWQLQSSGLFASDKMHQNDFRDFDSEDMP